MRPPLSCIVAAVAAGLLGASGAVAADDIPILDTHVHYRQNSWQDYAPGAVLLLLDQGGVRRAFFSSTPDDGTMHLYGLAPDRIVPVLRPYRQAGELSSWFQDPTVVPYLEQRLARPVYRGIGEFHLSGTDASAPIVRQVAELAARHGLFLHCHCDAQAVEILAGLLPGGTGLWAHAGVSAGAAEMGRLRDAGPNLAGGRALETGRAPGGQLDPAWRELFVRHADRFMLGTDTWIPSRFADYVDVQNSARTWLRQLPSEVASRLASENAELLARGR